MKSFWDEKFSQNKNLYSKNANEFIRFISPKLNLQGNMLAIAEGQGRNAIFLAKEAKKENKNLNIEVWDYSQVALEDIKKESKNSNLKIKTKEVDLTKANWEDNRFDSIFCVFGHFNEVDQKQILQGIKKSLKPNGWFFGEVYSKEQLNYKTGGPKDLDFLYDPNIFLEIFKNDFFFHFYVGQTYREEGALHNGFCHVIDFAIQIKK